MSDEYYETIFDHRHGFKAKGKSSTNLFKLISFYLDTLTAPSKRRFQQTVDKVFTENLTLSGSSTGADGFRFRGGVYRHSKHPRGQMLIPLIPSLSDEMDRALADREEFRKDIPLLNQIIFLLIDPCESLQELRDNLPDCLCVMVPELANMTRTNEVAYKCVKDGEASYKHLMDNLYKIEYYSATRLIF